MERGVTVIPGAWGAVMLVRAHVEIGAEWYELGIVFDRRHQLVHVLGPVMDAMGGMKGVHAPS